MKKKQANVIQKPSFIDIIVGAVDLKPHTLQHRTYSVNMLFNRNPSF